MREDSYTSPVKHATHIAHTRRLEANCRLCDIITINATVTMALAAEGEGSEIKLEPSPTSEGTKHDWPTTLRIPTRKPSSGLPANICNNKIMAVSRSKMKRQNRGLGKI